jgi:hypothetical protein
MIADPGVFRDLPFTVLGWKVVPPLVMRVTRMYIERSREWRASGLS